MTKTPIQNLSVTGTFNLDGDAHVCGNINISGNIILGNTKISEESYNELVELANQPLVPGPQGPAGSEGPPGPPGPVVVSENNDITTSNLGSGSIGDIAFGNNNDDYFLYVCYQDGNWGRIQLDVGF